MLDHGGEHRWFPALSTEQGRGDAPSQRGSALHKLPEAQSCPRCQNAQHSPRAKRNEQQEEEQLSPVPVQSWGLTKSPWNSTKVLCGII